MKEVIMLFAVLVALATSLEMIPVIGSNRKLAKIENIVGGKGNDPQTPTKRLPKHNLNRGQMKQMAWLRYVDMNA